MGGTASTGFTVAKADLPYTIGGTLTNSSDIPIVVTYTVTPKYGSCSDGTPQTVQVTVEPTPQATIVTTTPVICDGSNVDVTINSPTVPTLPGNLSYVVVVTSTDPGSLGGTASTGFTVAKADLPYTIGGTLTNSSDVPIVVTYTVTPKYGSCSDGTPQTVQVTVEPTPQATIVTTTPVICDGSNVDVTINSPTVPTLPGNLSYVVVVTSTDPGSLGGTASTGFTVAKADLPYTIGGTLTNSSDVPIVVTYTVTPKYGSCSDGTPQTVQVTVEPTPQATIVTTTPVICDGSNVDVTINSPTVPTLPGNLSYVVVVTSTDPGSLGGTASTGFTVAKADLPYTIGGTLTNSSDIPIVVTYTVTPKYGSCSEGTPQTVQVTVEPTPQATIVTTTPVICDGSNVDVTINSPTVPTLPGNLSYVVVVTSTDPGSLGGTASTGFTVAKADLPYTIGGTLTNSSDVPIVVTYTVTPKYGSCSDGTPQTVQVTVEPTPQATIVTTTPVICDGSNVDVTINSPTVTTVPGNLSYVVAVTSTDPSNLGGTASTGFTVAKADLPYTIGGTLTNSSDIPIVVTYTVTPKYGSCSDGTPQTVQVTVEPTPQATIVTTTPVICDGSNVDVTINSPTVPTLPGNLSYVVVVTSTDPGSLGGTASTGFTVAKADLPYTIGGTLTNSSDIPIVVTYTVTPKYNGCSDGPVQSITVTVNPTPRVIPINPNLKPDTSICFGTPTHIVLTSPTVMTSGSIQFDYTVAVSGGPGVIIGNTTPGSNLNPGYTINFPYQNDSDTIQSVYYSIIPKVDNALCVPGSMALSEVKVHAQPLQTIVVTTPLTCTGGAGLAALEAVISKGADPYHIVWDGPVGYHTEDLTNITNLSSGKYVVRVTDNLLCTRKDSINVVPVTARAYISASIIPPGNYNLSCIGSADGTILVSVTGGVTPPYNYTVLRNDTEVLFTGMFTNNLNLLDPNTYKYYSGLDEGTYTLIITDINGCENINKITLKVPPPVVVGFGLSSYSGAYNISCKGYNDGSAWVETISGGRGGYSYRWYTTDGNIPGPVNTNRIDNITAGTYYLEVTDVLGCVTVTSVEVTEPEGMILTDSQISLSPDSNYNISCNGGNDGSVSMTITGGSGDYLYSWTGPAGFSATTEDISGLRAGTYTCTVRDFNGCILVPSPEFTLTEPAALGLTFTTSTSNDGNYNINCYEGTGSVIVNVTGGSVGNYEYVWTTSDGSGIVESQKDQAALTAGTYHLEVRDMNGCVIFRDIMLTQPSDIITQITTKDITCQSPAFDNGSIDLTVSGGVAPYTYLWSNNETTQDISGLTEGTYTVIITYNGICTRRDSATINLPPPLEYTKTVSDYNGYNISCNGRSDGSIDINVNSGLPPYIYSWTGPNGFTSTAKDISDLPAGEYNLLITDSNLCTGMETINLSEPEILGMTFNLSSSIAGDYNINCAGESTGSIELEPVNQVENVDYLWDDGVFGSTRNNLPAGEYNVIIIDGNNCHASGSVTLTEPDSMKLSFDVTQPLCPDNPDGEIRLTVTGGVVGTDYSYYWSDNSTSKNISNILRGLYRVTVEDLNGCYLTDSVSIEPINQTCLVIPNAISPNDDLINDVWNIGMTDLYPQMEVSIFNRWGELVWKSEKGYPYPWDGTSKGAKLPIDSYHYVINLHNGERPMVGTITIVK